MLGKGKGPKVLAASERVEPVTNIPEGSEAVRSPSLGPYGQSLTAQRGEKPPPIQLWQKWRVI